MTIIFDPGALRSLFGSDYNQIDTLPIDITTTEKVSQRDSVTDKPTEDGEVKTLGTVTMPLVVMLSGIFTDDRFGGVSWGDKKDKLEAIKSSKRPFTIVTSIGTYDSMVFETLDYDRDRNNKGSLFFTASLRQITQISTRTVAVPVNERKNGKATDVGKKQPTSQTPEQQVKTNRTIAAYLSDAIFGN